GEKCKRALTLPADQGAADKRLLSVEGEFASLLSVIERQGNTLSPVLRHAWDGSRLQSVVKNSPGVCCEPHVSLIRHLTDDELRRLLSTTQMANGLGNRVLWVSVRRSKLLPDGGDLHDERFAELARSVGNSLATARVAGPLRRDGEASRRWHKVYGELSEG